MLSLLGLNHSFLQLKCLLGLNSDVGPLGKTSMVSKVFSRLNPVPVPGLLEDSMLHRVRAPPLGHHTVVTCELISSTSQVPATCCSLKSHEGEGKTTLRKGPKTLAFDRITVKMSFHLIKILRGFIFYIKT